MSNNTGGPAYPTNNWQKTVPLTSGYHEGMTLRDYFAAKAMQALVQANYFDTTAKMAYEMADAMLEARQQ